MASNVPKLDGLDLEGLLAQVDGCRRLARTLVGDAHRGDDVAQEALITGWQRAATRRKGWGPWLSGIVRNKARESARASRRRDRYEHGVLRRDDAPSTVESIQRVETQKQLLDAMLTLSEPNRMVILRRFFDNQPPRKIAGELGVPVETVRSRIKRALQQLRTELTTRHGGNERTWQLALLPMLAGGGVMVSKTKWGIAAAVLVSALSVVWWQVASNSDAMPPSPAPAQELVADGGDASDEAPTVLQGRPQPQPETPAPAAAPHGDKRLAGRVIDAGGAPQRDVEVWLRVPERSNVDKLRIARWRWRSTPSTPPARTTTTDARGRFVFRDLPVDGVFEVEARPPAPRVGALRRVQALTLSGQEFVLTVGEGVPLEGQVVDAQGNGIAAELEAYMLTGPFQKRHIGSAPHLRGIRTDADGRFRIAAIPVGVAELDVHVGGRVRRQFRVPVPSANVRLQAFEARGVTVRGAVVDAKRRPIANARVTIPIAEGELGLYAAGLALTDDDGAYVADGLPPGKLGEIVVDAEGFSTGTYGGGDRPLAAGDVVEANLTLQRGAAIEGSVRSADGEPIAGVQIGAHGPRYVAQRALSAEDGSFRFVVTPGARYALTGRGAGWYVPEQEDGAVKSTSPGLVAVYAPAEGGTTRIELIAARGAAIDVRVTDTDGTPVGDAVVSASVVRKDTRSRGAFFERRPAGLRTAADGTCRLSGLPPGFRWTLEARKGTQLALAEKPIELTSIETPQAVALTLREGARIAGRVLDENDRPVEGVGAALMTTYHYAMTTGSDGSFVFDGLAPGVYKVRIRPHMVDVEVAWGEKRDDIVVRVESKKRLRGVLRREDGSPVALSAVWVFNADNRNFREGNTITDAQGRFDVEVGAAKRYRLRVRSDWADGAWTPDDDIHAVVRSGGSTTDVTLRILGPDGAPVPTAKVTFERARGNHTFRGDKTVSDGTLVMQQPEEGESLKLTVTDVRDADGRSLDYLPQTLDIARGTSEREIRLREGRRIEGHVRDTEGQPVANVNVQAGDFIAQKYALTNDEGVFVLAALALETVKLTIRPPPAFLPVPAIEVPADQSEVRITLTRGHRHELRVVGADDEPVREAQVSMSGVHGGARWSRYGATNNDGVFVAEGIPERGVAKVRVTAVKATPPYPNAIRELELGGDLVIRLGAGVWIEGVVLNEANEPVAGASVAAYGAAKANRGVSARGRTDAAGAFRVGPVAAGRYAVRAEGGGFGGAEPQESDAPARGLRFVLPNVAKLEGTLHDKKGLDGWHIRFSKPGHTWQANKGDGNRFWIDDVSDVVGVVYAGHADGRYAMADDVRPSDGPFELHPKQGATITGLIENFQGPTKGPFLIAERGSLRIGARTTQDGRFTIQGLPPGRWKIVGYMGEPVGEIEAESGAKDVVFTYTP